jgi:MFS family permease
MSLWRNRDFLKLWGGQAVSDFGSQITTVALPLMAIFYLKASPAQLGLLGAAQFAPFLLFGLVAGVWVDRMRRRPLMLAADLLRALCIGAVPLLAVAHELSMPELDGLIFVFGTLGLFFDVSYQSYLPSLVDRDQLVEGNAKLSSTDTVSQVAGPAIGGFLVQAMTAPFVFVIDAVSFLFSALGLALIRKPEKFEPAPREERNLRRELGEGLGFVLHHRHLRIIAASTGTSNLFGRILFTVYALYLARSLHLDAGEIGLTFTASSLGAVLGVFLAGRAAERFGLGRAIAGSLILGNAALLLVPLARPVHALAVPLLLIGMFAWGISSPVYNINQVGLRQTITPDGLLGRMNASMRFLVWGTVPVGYLLGGALGTALGLWPTMLVGAIGGLLPALWLIPSRLIRLERMPEGVEDDRPAAEAEPPQFPEMRISEAPGGAEIPGNAVQVGEEVGVQ